jgi:hypothetical protein
VDVVVLDFFISGLKFLETLGLSKCQYLLCSEDIDVYVCENCGRLEFFLAKDPAHTQK